MTMMTMPERTCRGQAIASSCLSRPSRAETVHQYRKCGLRRTKGEGITGSDVTSFTVPTMWFPLAVQMQCTKATRRVACANLDLQDMTTCMLQMPMMPPGYKSCAAQHLICHLALYKGR